MTEVNKTAVALPFHQPFLARLSEWHYLCTSKNRKDNEQ